MMEPEGRRGYSGSLLLPAAALVVLIALVAVAAVLCTGGDGDSAGDPPEVTPTSAATPTVVTGTEQETALVTYVASAQQKEYAGPCAGTDVTEDAGKVCSIYNGERQGVHAFVLGLTFSEAFGWAFVAMQGGAWTVIHSSPITPESATVPGVPWPLEIGAEVVVIGTGSCLNVRTEPGGSAVDCIAEGTAITLSAGPQEADDREWWRVEGRDGWVAADYLRYPDATTDPEPAPTSAPADDGTPEATGTP
jgi:hypothetical protein